MACEDHLNELPSSGRQRRSIVATALLISVIPLIFVGGAIYYYFSKTHQTMIIDQIKTLAASQSQAAEVFLRERTTLLSVLAETHAYEQLSRHDVLSHLFTSMNLRGDMIGLLDLGVFDENGNQTAYVGPFDLRGLNYERQLWFNEVMTRGKFVSDVYLGYRRQPHFIIAVRGVSGHRSWALRATIDSEVFDRLVRATPAGAMGDAFIINAEGVFQTTPRRFGQVLEHSDIAPDRFSQGTITVEKKSIDGVLYYEAGAWLRNKNWLFVIRRPAS